MLCPDALESIDSITRYGLQYAVHDFGNGVELVLPDDPTLEISDTGVLDMMARSLRSTIPMDKWAPANFGFQAVQTHVKIWEWREACSSDIYRNPTAEEYLKIPVETKKGDIQFFAMNAVRKGAEYVSGLRVVGGKALLRDRRSGFTAVVFEEAKGQSVFKIIKYMPPKQYTEHEREFRRKTVDALTEKLEHLPAWIRRLCNDCPPNHPWSFDGATGSQNVFVEGFEQVMDGEFTITLIDQAHPTLRLRAFHSLAQFFVNAPAVVRHENIPSQLCVSEAS